MSRKGHKGPKGKKAASKTRRKNPPKQAMPSAEEVVGAVLAAAVPALFEAADSADSAPEASAPRVRAAAARARRTDHRVHARVALSVAIGLETESHFFAGLSGDVSEGGVFVQTYRDLPVGSAVEVHFDLPAGEVTAHGHVRWHRDHSDSSPPGLGIAFEELAGRDREMIQRFCERRSPLYYDVEMDAAAQREAEAERS